MDNERREKCEENKTGFSSRNLNLKKNVLQNKGNRSQKGRRTVTVDRDERVTRLGSGIYSMCMQRYFQKNDFSSP